MVRPILIFKKPICSVFVSYYGTFLFIKYGKLQQMLAYMFSATFQPSCLLDSS